MKKLFTKLLAIASLIVIGTNVAMADEVEIITVAQADASIMGSWPTESVTGSNGVVWTNDTRDVSYISKYTLDSNDGSLNFGGSPSATAQAIRIKVRLKNGGQLIVGGKSTYNNPTYKYAVVAVGSSDALSFSASSNSSNTSISTITLNSNLNGEYYIYVGRNNSNFPNIKSVEVKTNPGTESYTVSFDAGANGECSTSSLTESAPNAGVELPQAIAATGYKFFGWSTNSTAKIVDAGKAGQIFKPYENTTLYACYTPDQILEMSVLTRSAIMTLGQKETKALTAEDINIVGGTAELYNAASSSKDMISKSGQVNLGGSSSSYIKIVLDYPVYAGDIIYVKSDATGSFAIGNTTSNSATVTSEKSVYVVKNGDVLEGVSEIYIFKKNSSLISGVYINHPVSSATLNANGFATFSSPTEVSVTGAEAYTATVDEENATITWTKIANDIIPANEGVLLKGETGATATFTASAESATNIAGNALKPNLVATTKAELGEYIYVLSGENIMRLSDTGTLGANKAYFSLSQYVTEASNSGAKGFRMIWNNGDTATGISTIETAKTIANGAAYNLAGQRVNANAKGIVVVNGKKYINK